MTPATVQTIGSAAALLTTLCWDPQAVRTIRTRDTRAVSLWTQAILATGILLWLVYGLLLGSLPLIAANGVSFVLVATILALKVRYG